MNLAEAKALKKQRQREARKAKEEQERAAAEKAERDANPPKVDWSEDVEFGEIEELPKFDASWKETIDKLVHDESAVEDVSRYLNLLEETTMSRYEEKSSDPADVLPKVRVRVDPKSLSERAKRWGTSTWLAQWLINAVDYCKSQVGKNKLENWIKKNFGPDEARKRMQACEKEPLKRTGKFTGFDKTFNAAAFELGVSEDGLKIFHWFVSHNHIVQPPRTEAPVQRLPWEPSSSWLPRRHRSIVDGHQFPDMDWEEVRRIAISQFDMARDKREVWRTQPDIFFEAVAQRAESSLISDQFEKTGGPLVAVIGRMTESYKFTLHVAQCTYAHWSRAAKLVEDITRMGLTTPTEIEHAYRADPKLMWRLASCAGTAYALFSLLWARLAQVMSNSKYYKPYFRRQRTKEGKALIEPDDDYINAHPLNNRLDKLIVQACSEGGSDVSDYCAFFDRFDTLLKINPEEVNKFDAVTLQEIADVAIVYDFYSDFADSRFGQRLIEAVKEAESAKTSSADLVYAQVGVVSKARLTVDRFVDTFGSASIVAAGTVNTWIEPCSANDPHPKLMVALVDRSSWDGPASDMLWNMADKRLWDFAKPYDPPHRPGFVASTFGLYNPNDSTRPMHSQFYFHCLDQKNGPHKAESTPTPAFRDSGELPDEKGDDKQIPQPYEQLPVKLPTTYQLGKKSVKLLHRFVDDTKKVGVCQTSPLRWSDLEKALKRLNFDVVRKPYLSLRFDPPATSARPVLFYCRDTNAAISASELKWISARLKRRYGFTVASFEQTAHDSNE